MGAGEGVFAGLHKSKEIGEKIDKMSSEELKTFSDDFNSYIQAGNTDKQAREKLKTKAEWFVRFRQKGSHPELQWGVALPW